MELSDRTLSVLRNFSGINGNLLIGEGTTIRTVSESRTVLAEAYLDIEFPRSFGIYDLREFLSVLNLVESPNLTFEDNYVTISSASGRSSIKYFYSDPSTLTTVTKTIDAPCDDAWFRIDRDTLNKIKSAASALGHTEVIATIDNGAVVLTVRDNDDATSNAFSVMVEGESKSEDMSAVFNINNLKLLEDGDYEVQISRKLISKFCNTDPEGQSTYWVALQKSSKF
jgi:hypothetical protein